MLEFFNEAACQCGTQQQINPSKNKKTRNSNLIKAAFCELSQHKSKSHKDIQS